MGTSGDVAGTPFPRDLYDLAVAGARFTLEGHPEDGASETLRSTVTAFATRRSLHDLAPAWERAGASLIARGVSAAALEALVAERAESESLGQLLLRRADLPESEVADVLAHATTAPLIALTTQPVHGEPFRSPEEALAAPKHPVLIDEIAARRVPRELEERHDMILVAAWEDTGVIAMVDPGDEAAAREAEEASGLRLIRFTALASQLRLAIGRCWQPRPDVDVSPIGEPRQALPFLTAVGGPALVLAIGFLFVFRDALNLRQIFALSALACGLFFFSYALRYYVTTAAVIGTVLFGDRLRRNRLISRVRAAGNADPAHRSAHDYRTLRGERLDDIGAIVTADPERIGAHRLRREDQPFVSVQLAMYNERHVVDRLLTACTSFDYDSYEVIVADDSTDPEALAILDKWTGHPRVRILHRPTRKGFKGAALQEALKRMDPRTEYVMIFDADFIPPPDAIWHFLDYFGRLPGANGEMVPAHGAGDLTRVASGTPVNGDRLAAVQGYQWHMLNASENWITKGIRTEFSGSYVLERAAQELFGTMKMISGSVYMIRADVLRRLGWSTSITEDWELTIRLYLAGYKVLYTPYIQAPSECVSHMKQLIRQRMRWARGHTFNVKRYFFAVLRSPNMSWREKAEFLYYAPYYLQSILFLAGTVAWVVGIFLLGQRLPQWGAALGWSLVISNVLALPLMNLAGLILEGSVKRDSVGLGSFIGLSTLLAPFQGWAALRGLLEPTEGGWARTPKSGHITEAIGALKLGKLLPWEMPNRRKPSSRVTHVLVTCIAGFLAGSILTIGALSLRAAASTGKVQETELLASFVVGTLLPLGIVVYGWVKLHRRIAVCVLAAAVGLASNVVFLASTVPASAYAGTGATFMFKNATVFASPNFDMEQGYTPAGAATQTPASLGNTWTAIFASDIFPATASMNAGTAVVDLYGENNIAGVISYVGASATAASGASGNVTPALPTSWAQNDLLILALQTDDNVDSDVSGWTALFEVNNGTTSRASVFYKIAGASESNPTVTHTSGNSVIARVYAFRGVDTANPIEAWDQVASASDLNTEAPAISTTVPNTMLVFTTHVKDNWTAVAWPTGWTGVWAQTGSGNDSGTGMAYVAATAAGTQAAVAMDRTGGGAAAVSNGAQIALRPETRNCTVTVTLKHVSGSPTTLGSGTGTFASPSSTSGTLTQVTFSANDVAAFADGDRLDVEVSVPNDANCNARLHFDGASQQSKLVTATIVPEGVLALLLLAPLLPLAVRRRWIRLPFAR